LIFKKNYDIIYKKRSFFSYLKIAGIRLSSLVKPALDFIKNFDIIKVVSIFKTQKD
jgi:hypothetical protein